MSSQQWAAHQQQALKEAKNTAFRYRQNATPEQRENYQNSTELYVEIYANLVKDSDVPDELAEAIAEKRVWQIVAGQ